MWHKIDTLHKTPKTEAYFQLCGPTDPETGLSVLHATPRATTANQLLTRVLEDVLTEEAYLADMAGLHCSVDSGFGGMNFKFSGFSEKLPILAQKVFDTFSLLKVFCLIFKLHFPFRSKIRASTT